MFRVGRSIFRFAEQVAEKATADKKIIVEHFKNFSKVVINNPKSLNSLTIDMIKELRSLLPQLDKTKAFWIEGAGGKAFSAGGDVKDLYLNREKNPSILADFFREEYILDYKMSKLHSLQISNWDGYVMGGGVGLSVFSPFRIATENTIFAMPENKIGFFTDVCGGYFLSRLRNNIGYFLGLSGMHLKGEDVYKAGIANYFIPRENLPQVFKDLKAELIHSREPKETVEDVLMRYNRAPANRIIENEGDIRFIFGSDSIEEIYDKLDQKRNPFFVKVKEAIDQQCPISVNVTFESIRRSKEMDMKDCYEADYAVSQRFMEGKDFFEGVRCTLVDKGVKPKWTHASAKDIKEEDVLKYFKSLAPEKRLKI